jgi:hypothetical protein
MDRVDSKEKAGEEGGRADREEAARYQEDQHTHQSMEQDVRQVEPTGVSLPQETIPPIREGD